MMTVMLIPHVSHRLKGRSTDIISMLTMQRASLSTDLRREGLLKISGIQCRRFLTVKNVAIFLKVRLTSR